MAFPPVIAAYLARACQDNGLIGRAVAGSALAFCPPLIITEAQVDELAEKLSKGLDKTLAHVKEQGLIAA